MFGIEDRPKSGADTRTDMRRQHLRLRLLELLQEKKSAIDDKTVKQLRTNDE